MRSCLVGLVLALLAPAVAQPGSAAEGGALLDHALRSVRSLASAGQLTPDEEQAAVRRMVQMDERLLVRLAPLASAPLASAPLCMARVQASEALRTRSNRARSQLLARHFAGVASYAGHLRAALAPDVASDGKILE